MSLDRRSTSRAACARDVATLHAELVRYGLVVWTGGNVSRPRARRRPASSSSRRGVDYDDLAPENMILCDLDGQRRPGDARQRARAVERHRRARLRLPEHAGGRRRRAHPLDLRDGVGGARRGDPVRASRRWPTSSAATSRSDRSRSSATTRSAAASSRPSTGHRSPRRADAEPRAVHDRPRRAGRRQGGGHVSRTSPAPCTSPASSASPIADPAGRDRRALRPLPERLRPGSDPQRGAMT